MPPVNRTRSAEWKVVYLQKKDHISVYLGQWLIGNIKWTTNCILHKVPHYAGHLNLPGMYGPVVQTADLHEAKIEITAKVKQWTQGMNEYPVDTEEREQKPTTTARVVRRRRTVDEE